MNRFLIPIAALLLAFASSFAGDCTIAGGATCWEGKVGYVKSFGGSHATAEYAGGLQFKVGGMNFVVPRTEIAKDQYLSILLSTLANDKTAMIFYTGTPDQTDGGVGATVIGVVIK